MKVGSKVDVFFISAPNELDVEVTALPGHYEEGDPCWTLKRPNGKEVIIKDFEKMVEK